LIFLHCLPKISPMKHDSKRQTEGFKKYSDYHHKIANALRNKTSKYFIRLILFIILYKLGQYTFNFFETREFSSEIFNKIYYLLSSFINNLSVKFYSLFYAEISSDSVFCITINNVRTIQMNPGCTGLLPLFQMFFILLFFPLTFKQKILFFPVSLLIIVFAAIIHYLILIPVAYSFHESFTLFHDIISRVIFYLFFFVNFVLWNRSSEKINSSKILRIP